MLKVVKVDKEALFCVASLIFRKGSVCSLFKGLNETSMLNSQKALRKRKCMHRRESVLKFFMKCISLFLSRLCVK